MDHVKKGGKRGDKGQKMKNEHKDIFYHEKARKFNFKF